MDIKKLNEELNNVLNDATERINETIVSRGLLENEAEKQFQPFITLDEYKKEHKRNAYMILGTVLVYINEKDDKIEILNGWSKDGLLNELRAISKYKEEIEIGRNKITL